MTSRNNPVPDAITVATGPGSIFSLPARAAAGAPPAAPPGRQVVPRPAGPTAPVLPRTGGPDELPGAAALVLLSALLAGTTARRLRRDVTT